MPVLLFSPAVPLWVAWVVPSCWVVIPLVLLLSEAEYRSPKTIFYYPLYLVYVFGLLIPLFSAFCKIVTCATPIWAKTARVLDIPVEEEESLPLNAEKSKKHLEVPSPAKPEEAGELSQPSNVSRSQQPGLVLEVVSLDAEGNSTNTAAAAEAATASNTTAHANTTAVPELQLVKQEQVEAMV